MKKLFKSIFNIERGTNDECNDFIIKNLDKLQLVCDRKYHTFHVTDTDKYVIFLVPEHYNIYENKKPIVISNKIVNFGCSVSGQCNRSQYINETDLRKGKIIEDWFITNYPKQTTEQLVNTVFDKNDNIICCDIDFLNYIPDNNIFKYNDGITVIGDLDLSNFYQPINIYTENGLEVLNSKDIHNAYYIEDGRIKSSCFVGLCPEYTYYINSKIAEDHLSIMLKKEFDSYFSVMVKGDNELEKKMFDFFVEFHDYKKTLQFYNSVVK